MSDGNGKSSGPDWVCGQCDDQALVSGNVQITYMGGVYTVGLLKCPRCGLVFVPEDLAMGKMAEVERVLEDK